MFSLVNGVYDSYLAPTQINLLIVGPAGVGKTAILERLKVTQFPKRPRQQPSLSLAPLPPILEEAFLPDEEEEEDGSDGNVETITASTEASTAAEDGKEAGQRPLIKSVTSSSSLSKTTPRKNSHRRSGSQTPSVVVTQAQRRGIARLICPAPERYRNSKDDQDEEFVPYDNNSITSHANDDDDDNSLTHEPLRQRTHSKEFNVDELTDINGGSSAPPPPSPARVNGVNKPTRPTQTNGVSSSSSKPSNIPQSIPNGGGVTKSPLLQVSDKEYDRKPNSKMLPMTKIRPTIGTNLGKVHMYGAQVNLFDVGGKMQNLWDKYYDDCDGVVFCWKLGGDDPIAESDSDNEGDDEKKEPLDAEKQQEILEQVRKAIPDDVPFLVFGHIFGNANRILTDKIFGTNILLPHYHNPMTGLCCGSAKTGAGFQSAMEWLIPLAKRQQKERLSNKSSLPKTL